MRRTARRRTGRTNLRLHRVFAWMPVVVLVLGLAQAAPATEIAGSSITLPYFFQQSYRGEQSTHLALFEFAQFEASDVGTPGLDMYFSGWGRWDALDAMDPEEEAVGDAELDAAFVRWRHEDHWLDVSLGRRFVHTGPAAERIDGLQIQLDPVRFFGLQGFGGIPVTSQVGQRDGDWAYGGRLYLGWRPWFEIGFSSAAFTEKSQPDRQRFGGDVTVLPGPWVDLLGHAYYDSLFNALVDAEATLVVRPVQDLKILGQIDRLMPSALLGMQSFFSVFSFDSITTVNSEVSYVAWRRLAVSGLYNLVTYDHGDPANRYGGSLGLLWGEARENTLDLGARRLDRQDNGTLELRGYLYQRLGADFFTAIDAVHYRLDRAVWGTDEGFNGALSLGWHVTEDLDLSTSGFYRTSPYYEQDVRALIKVAYNFNRIF